MLSLAVGPPAAMAKVSTHYPTRSGKSLAQPLTSHSHSNCGDNGSRLSIPTSRTSLSFKTAVAAIDSSNQLCSSSSGPPEKQQANKYYFVVANAKFMLDEEEHFKELMFERLRNYGERNKEQDFWLVIEPKFLDKFPNITKRLRRPAVALVSTNEHIYK